MGHKRFDNTPKFLVKDDSVVIQQVAGSSVPLLDLRNSAGDSVLTVSHGGQLNSSSTALTGVPTAPTAAPGTNTTQIATTAFVRGEVASVVDSAPALLDTLDELAAALGDDANFSTTITNSIAGKAPLVSPTFTGIVTLPSSTSIGTVSDIEIGYLDGVTSSIQTQINSKAPSSSPTFTGTVTLPSTTSIGNVSSVEIGYVDGVTSSIQTQIDSKSPIASPTFTGTPAAPTASAGTNTTQIATTAFVRSEISSLIGAAPSTLDTLNEIAAALGNDANYATTITTALSLKAPLASPTFTGTVVLPSSTSIGNVSSTELSYVDGVTSSIQTQLDGKANLSGASFSGAVSVSGNITASSGGDIIATPAVSGGNAVWYNDYGAWATQNKVGIGLSNPGFNFEVSGRIKLRTSGDTAGIWFTNSSGDQYMFTGLINDTQWGVYGVNKWQFSVTNTACYITDSLIFDYLGIQFDRAWDNYPGLMVRNDQRLGPPWEFRIHGFSGVSGPDFGVYVRSDGGGNASDARIKTNVTTIDSALEKVLSLRGVRYQRWNRDLEVETHMSEAEGFRFGVIAQEVLPIIPEVVKSSENPTVLDNGWSDEYAVDYGSITPLLIEAIKELTTRVEELEAANG